MTEPLFYQGQRIVYMGMPAGLTRNPDHPMVIEGNSYYVKDPNALVDRGRMLIELQGLEGIGYDQRAFAPYDDDRQMENEIHEALKQEFAKP